MSDDTKLEELRNRFRVVDSDPKIPTKPEEPKLPENTYAILDIDGTEWINHGFLIFTSHHVAIMRETDQGALPVLVMPLDRVRVAELVPPEELED